MQRNPRRIKLSKDLLKEEVNPDPIVKRLDAIIRLIIETNKLKENEKLSEGDVARHLNSVGLSPTEIARILGKKSRTQISKYLYGKNKESDQTAEAEQTIGGKNQ
jgi:hypothetical protein